MASSRRSDTSQTVNGGARQSVPAGIDFQLLFEQAPGAYLTLSPDLEIVAVTDAYLRTTNTRREELIGRGLFEAFPENPDEPEPTGERNLRTSLMRVVEHREPDAMAVQKYDIPRPGELGGGYEERYWSAVNTPVLDTDGELCYIIHRVEDVTDFVLEQQAGSRQRTETAELRARTESMEREIIARGRELQAANDDLRRTAELLRRADERGRFLAMTSHELRTPLTSISGFATTLRELWEQLEDEQRLRFIDIIEAQSDRLARLVDDLLLLSQIESGKLSIEPRVTQVCELLSDVVRDLDVEAAIECAPELVANVDPHRLRQIAINLLSNAYRYGAPPVTVSVSLRGRSLVMAVSDHGPGVGDDFRQRMFLEFARERSAGPPVDDHGTGLGLAIVKRLAEAHGGFVRYERHRGVTTMRVRLRAT